MGCSYNGPTKGPGGDSVKGRSWVESLAADPGRQTQHRQAAGSERMARLSTAAGDARLLLRYCRTAQPADSAAGHFAVSAGVALKPICCIVSVARMRSPTDWSNNTLNLSARRPDLEPDSQETMLPCADIRAVAAHILLSRLINLCIATTPCQHDPVFSP